MELKDRVEQISGLIKELHQSAGAGGRRSRELIDAIFRAVHSFKAAASAANRPDAGDAAHQLEELLQALRTGQLPLDNEILDVLKHNAAVLLDGSGYFGAFDHFTVTEFEKASGQVRLPDEAANLRAEERHRAAAALQEGSNLYVMEMALELPDFDVQIRQLKENLGEVISTQARAETDKVFFRIVYASKSEKIRVHTLLEEAARAGKSVAANLDKEVEFVVRGDESLLNRRWSDALTDALLHLVRNAIVHGIESSGTVILETTTTSGATTISVTDDGRGIAPENLPLVFQPGFTTAPQLTAFSGRGVGLDAVKSSIEILGGSVTVTSEPHKGSSFKITIPNPSSDA